MRGLRFVIVISFLVCILITSTGVQAADSPHVFAQKFIPLQVGSYYKYNVTDSQSSSWDSFIVVTGISTLTNGAYIGKTYFFLEQFGQDSPDSYDTGLVRSTDSKMIGYEAYGSESIIFKNSSAGTAWQYVDRRGNTMKQTIEAIETVTVPAGTYTNCLRILEECISCVPTIIEGRVWVKPGFMAVKEEDYDTDNAPLVKVLTEKGSYLPPH